jgi:hypothetical protein
MKHDELKCHGRLVGLSADFRCIDHRFAVTRINNRNCKLIPMSSRILQSFYAALAILAITGHADAMDNALRAGLLKLDPQTRLEQRCDAEVLDRITQDNRQYRADRVVAYAFATPQMTADSIRSPGAAFRSKGEWYRLKFKCETAPDHMEVLDFKYKIGAEIPKDEWTRYNLYD